MFFAPQATVSREVVAPGSRGAGNTTGWSLLWCRQWLCAWGRASEWWRATTWGRRHVVADVGVVSAGDGGNSRGRQYAAGDGVGEGGSGGGGTVQHDGPF